MQNFFSEKKTTLSCPTFFHRTNESLLQIAEEFERIGSPLVTVKLNYCLGWANGAIWVVTKREEEIIEHFLCWFPELAISRMTSFGLPVFHDLIYRLSSRRLHSWMQTEPAEELSFLHDYTLKFLLECN